MVIRTDMLLIAFEKGNGDYRVFSFLLFRPSLASGEIIIYFNL